MAKYTPKSETIYRLSMFDHDTPSLDGIVSEAIGVKYVGQQTGDMERNDTEHSVSMVTDDDIADAMCDEDEEPFISSDRYGYGDSDRFYYNFESWIEAGKTDPYFTEDKFGYKFERAAPGWRYALAWCVKNDLLPRGNYVISIWW